MRIVAGAVRGSWWLAWLGLVLAAFVATADPGVCAGSEDDDGPEHADGCAASFSLAPVPAAVRHLDSVSSAAGAALAPTRAWAPPATTTGIVTPSRPRLVPRIPLLRLSPRAPPSVHSL